MTPEAKFLLTFSLICLGVIIFQCGFFLYLGKDKVTKGIKWIMTILSEKSGEGSSKRVIAFGGFLLLAFLHIIVFLYKKDLVELTMGADMTLILGHAYANYKSKQLDINTNKDNTEKY